MKKRILSLLLSIVMLIALLPATMTVYAATSGTCGANLTWTLDDSGTLTIIGSGDMTDYSHTGSKVTTPWYSSCTNIKKLIIDDDVTSIGNFAFYGCDNLTDIKIPNNVSSIGEYAFCGTAATNIKIPGSVVSIDYNAFASCSKLTNVEICDGVQNIDSYVFNNCSALTSITIPSSVSSIGWGSFDCKNLESINVDENNQNFSSVEGILFNKTQTELLLYPKGKESTAYTIPEGVLVIGALAFSGHKTLTDIVIPESVTKIKYSAFSSTLLQKLTVPENVTEISQSSFSSCYYLNEINWNAKNAVYVDYEQSSNYVFSSAGTKGEGISVIFGNTVESIPDEMFYPSDFNAGRYTPNIKSISIGENVSSIGSNAFRGTAITNLKIPKSVVSVGNCAFYSCNALTNLEICDGVQTIGRAAFYNCTGLTSISVPESVISIGEYAFYGCEYLNEINWNARNVSDFSESNYTFYNTGISGDGVSVTFGDTVEHIPSHMFEPLMNNSSSRTNVVKVVISDNVTTIGKRAFHECKSLKHLTLGKNVASIGKNAFYRCTNLTDIMWNAKNVNDDGVDANNNWFYNAGTEGEGVSLVYGDDVEKIPQYSFDRSNITSIHFGSKIKTIGKSAFSYSTALESVKIPDGVTVIDDGVFSGCTALKNVEIPDNVTTIGNYAFSGCSALENIEIPNSVTAIGNYAIYGCTALENIEISDGVTTIGDHAIDNTGYYNNSANWENNVLYLGKHLIKAKNTLSGNYIVKENTLTIGISAFDSCSNLKTIEIPNSVTSIGQSAFSSCYGLKSLVVPGSVINIGNNAFSYCSNITIVAMNMGTESIGDKAFYNCSKLNIIDLPASIRTIGENAFSNCNNLSSIQYIGTEQEFNAVSMGSGNEILTTAKKTYALQVNVYDGNDVLVKAYTASPGALLNYDALPQLDGHSMKIYSDKERTLEFNYLKTPITQNSNFYLGYSINQYTHKFLNDDGAVLKEASIDYGTVITAPENPTKPADDQYTYTFAGWEGFEEGITQKAEEMVFTAKYDKTVNQYSYHFVDEDGTVLKEDTVDYGTEIIPPENPTKQGSAQYSYTFTGWDGFTEGMTQTAEDLYFYATYSASVNQYTYKFVDWDGTVLKEKTVNYNTMITPPSNPSKVPDAQFTYTFAGWDGYTVGMKATEDVTFTATYSNTVNQYTYKFVDALGNTILEKTVDYGTVIELPQEEITKASDDEFTYTFTGWDGYRDDMTVTGNITFAPLFSKTTNKYSYQFIDEDGTVLKENTVDYGTVITAPSNPSKEADAQYTYTFKGWKGFTEGIKQTAQTMVFTAEYTATVNQYTYKFVDEDGSVIKTQTVDYGTAITPPGNPSKASTNQYSYKFIGWSGYTDGMTVTKDETFKATYEEITNQYTYKFVDYAGNIVKEATVDYGTVIVTPTTPDGYSDQQYTYIFASWTGYVRGMKVTKDITFNAKYTSVLNQYTYVFMDENGNLLSEDTVDYGTKITPPEAPEKASTVQYSYEFAGWENYTDGVIVDDVIFIATYKPITNKYTYRFENEDGTEIKTVTADYGSIIEVPRNPQKEATAQYSYEFAGWGGYADGMTLTGDITFKATYTSIINQYTYKFTDEDGEVLKALTVDYGTKIILPDTTPQKDADVQYTYTFKEWAGFADGMTVTSDVTFVAVYNSILNQYTYKFLNEDGTLVKEQKADYGSEIVLPDAPSKDATQQYSYKFIGWDGYTDGMTVAGDVVFTAKYTPVINQYTYVFKNDDGTEIKSVTADYGTDIIVPENPTKASTVQYSYTFASWSNYINGMSLTEDITFVATYTSTLNQYTYKFIDNDGTELKSATVDYGTRIVAPSAPADKGAYTFDCWEGFADGMIVAGDVTFKAVYKYKTYNISVDGYEISSNATYGENYVITPAERYGYNFVGYYTEADGNGTKLTDSEGNSLNAYGYEKDITVYPYFADLLVNKAVLSGATSMQVGDIDVKYTLTLGTDRENITYATVFVKYPNSLSISKLEKKADIAEVIQEKDTVNGEYTTTEIVIIYSNDKAMPIKTPIEVFDIYFNVSKTADTKDIAISLTNNSVLMDSTSDYRFAELVGANATIKAKFPENIAIEGEVVIDSPTKYTAIVTPDYATYDVEWSVNDASIASITVDGILTPIKNGTVIITAKSLNNPEVFATREITVKAYAKVASITTDGFWTEEFVSGVKEYTVYVDEDTTEFSITPVSASGGRFKINGSTVFSNRTETISLTEDETEVVITLTGATGYTDNTYKLTIVKFEGTKTTVSDDDKSFTIAPINIENGKMVILALYDGGKFVEFQKAIYEGEEITFTTDKTYTDVKVMVWNDLTNLKPVCSVEELN